VYNVIMLKQCVIFLITAASLFAQSTVAGNREQGLYTGDPVWRQALGGHVLSLPSVQVQSAVVALDGGNIRAYSTAGTPMWNYSARGRISPYVSRSREGTSYFSRTNGTFIAVNRAGRELWRRNIGGALAARVIPGWDGRLFVPTDKKIACYTASGNLLWSRQLDSGYFLPPKLDREGGILFALENNEIYRIDQFGNTHIWTVSIKPAVLLPIEDRQVMVLHMDGTMTVLGHAEEWFFSARGEMHSSLLPRLPYNPIAAASRGNNIAIVYDTGRVALYSQDEKEIIWTKDSHIREFIRGGGKPEPSTPSPSSLAEPLAEVLFDERGIYILSRNGATGFSHNGDRRWFTFLQNTAAIPAFGNDGVLYSGGRDWILYAYKIEDRTLPVRSSPYGPAPEGVYGMGRPQSAHAEDLPLNEYELRIKLDQISYGINAGRVGENEPLWTTILMTTAAGDYHLQYKLDALHMLGIIGSQETVPWLVNVFRRETEPTARAAAANAIGAIGVDPDGVAIQTFLFLLVSGGGIRDEQVLLAITSATGALCRFSGPPLSETGVRILTMLSTQNQPPIVVRQAKREIASLR
jgi:outer membrane protein assembly factor BamB